MKNLKAITVSLVILFGILTLAFKSHEAKAQVTIGDVTIGTPEISFGRKIPCTSTWSDSQKTWVVACDTCSRTRGKFEGGLSGECKPN